MNGLSKYTMLEHLDEKDKTQTTQPLKAFNFSAARF